MEALTLKPHHFMDILKLYGAGVEEFVPDKKLGHDFYRAGNLILENPDLPVFLTSEGDDICRPCRAYRGCCQDGLSHIPGYTSKDAYNHQLDSRIFSLFGLSGGPYTALELCEILYADREKIFQVWIEEESSAVQQRCERFTAGAEKYLACWQKK